MPRPKDPGRREELVDALVDHLLAGGAADLSLRGAAAALGISTFPLTYHFGSKEGLMAAALAGHEARLQAMVMAWVASEPGGDPGALVRRFWAWVSREELLPSFRLFFEVWGLALQRPDRYPGVLEAAWAPWVALLRRIALESGVPANEADAVAGLGVAASTGAMLGLLTTGDQAGADRTIALAADAIDRCCAAASEKQ